MTCLTKIKVIEDLIIAAHNNAKANLKVKTMKKYLKFLVI